MTLAFILIGVGVTLLATPRTRAGQLGELLGGALVTAVLLTSVVIALALFFR